MNKIMDGSGQNERFVIPVIPTVTKNEVKCSGTSIILRTYGMAMMFKFLLIYDYIILYQTQKQ